MRSLNLVALKLRPCIAYRAEYYRQDFEVRVDSGAEKVYLSGTFSGKICNEKTEILCEEQTCYTFVNYQCVKLFQLNI